MVDANKNPRDVRQTIPLNAAEKTQMDQHCQREGRSNRKFQTTALCVLNRLPEETVGILLAFEPGKKLWDAEQTKLRKGVGGTATRGQKRG